MNLTRSLHLILLFLATAISSMAVDPWNTVRIPEVGDYRMLVLSPTVIELSLVTTSGQGESASEWKFANGSGKLLMPEKEELQVLSGGKNILIARLGFKRRVHYAPLNRWDLRISSFVYIELSEPIQAGDSVQFKDASGRITLDGTLDFQATFSPQNFSPVFHVNQAGYAANLAKLAKAGYYLGSMGELDLSAFERFYVRDIRTGELVLEAPIVTVKEEGMGNQNLSYQKVLHLDFTRVEKPGTYTVGIIGLGESYPFWISNNYWANLTRTYALGTYHQRCGCAVEKPYTRFTHEACHVHKAAIPTMDPEFNKTQDLIRDINDPDNPNQTAPELMNVASSLYPFVKKGEIDVSGGHHDAGDYSKYTINSALFVNALMTAVDAFPNVDKIDNLGLPESDDGISDILQIAKYEADFLAKLQDDDGGFFFLVYPKERAYESEVAPDKGDDQVVFPKNTASTAAASAALAQMASSKKFRFHFPMEASRMLEQAKRGWEFLEKAWAEHGEIGAYQTISHYGDTFMDRDEIMWAATELFLATGENKYHDFILKSFDPEDPEIRRWKWLRLYESYGAAIRSYALADTSGKRAASKLDSIHFRACTKEILNRADELNDWSRQSAYGVAFPPASKSMQKIGWFFAASDAFDLVNGAVAGGIRKFDTAVTTNLNYELGTNPNNISFVTGLGWRRQFEIVHQWARNDQFALPMSGIPIGSLQDGLPWIPPYEGELGRQNFPSDGASSNAFAFYDRWTDTFNVGTEFVNFQQARSLATCAYYMAKNEALVKHPWKVGKLEVSGTPEVALVGETVVLTATSPIPSLDIGEAFLIWETRGQQPIVGPVAKIVPTNSGLQWFSVSAQWPDGRRTYADGAFTVTRPDGGIPVEAEEFTAFLLSADHSDTSKTKNAPMRSGGTLPGMPHATETHVEGKPAFSTSNLGWMQKPSGAALAFDHFEDSVQALWNTPTTDATRVEISGWFYFEKFPHAVMTAEQFTYGSPDATPLMSLHFDQWDKPAYPRIQLGHETVVTSETFSNTVKTGEWQFLMIQLSAAGWHFYVDNEEVAKGNLPEGYNLSLDDNPARELRIGHFIGTVDELRVRELP